MFRFAASAGLLVLICRAGIFGRHVLVVLLTLVLGADLMTYGLPAKPTLPSELVLQRTPLMREAVSKGQRVLSLAPAWYEGEGFPPPLDRRRSLLMNLGIYDGVEECGGFVTLYLGRPFYDFCDFMGIQVPFRVTHFLTTPPPNLMTILPLVRACAIDWIILPVAADIPGLSLRAIDQDLSLYRVLNTFPRAYTVSQLVPAASAENGMEQLIRGVRERSLDLRAQAIVASADALPARKLVRGRAELTYRRNTRATVAVESPGETFLVLTDAYRPQWEAFVDGAPTRLYQANGIFRGLFVPAGKHVVEFRYHDRAYEAGKWVTAATALLLALFFGLPSGARLLRRARRKG
jgi:hypothetical protein